MRQIEFLDNCQIRNLVVLLFVHRCICHSNDEPFSDGENIPGRTEKLSDGIVSLKSKLRLTIGIYTSKSFFINDGI